MEHARGAHSKYTIPRPLEKETSITIVTLVSLNMIIGDFPTAEVSFANSGDVQFKFKSEMFVLCGIYLHNNQFSFCGTHLFGKFLFFIIFQFLIWTWTNLRNVAQSVQL